MQSSLEFCLAAFCMLFLVLNKEKRCNPQTFYIVIISVVWKGVVLQLLTCCKVAVVICHIVNANLMRLVDMTIFSLIIWWHLYVIVAFFLSMSCVSEAGLLWIAMMILFLDSMWMLFKCILFTGCLCFCLMIIMGFLGCLFRGHRME